MMSDETLSDVYLAGLKACADAGDDGTGWDAAGLRAVYELGLGLGIASGIDPRVADAVGDRQHQNNLRNFDDLLAEERESAPARKYPAPKTIESFGFNEPGSKE